MDLTVNCFNAKLVFYILNIFFVSNSDALGSFFSTDCIILFNVIFNPFGCEPFLMVAIFPISTFPFLSHVVFWGGLTVSNLH